MYDRNIIVYESGEKIHSCISIQNTCYDFNRYFLALPLPSATVALLETSSAKYIFVREICRSMASAIWTLLASGVSVKY